MDENSKVFKSYRLKERMRVKGFDVKALAFACNMNQSMVYKYLGGTAPMPDALASMALALDTTVDYLLGLSDDPIKYVANSERLDEIDESILNLLRSVDTDERLRILSAIKILISR
jgi:transcriptional regulator with XRE-family HTH domain